MTVKELQDAFKKAIESNDYSDDMQVIFLDSGNGRYEIDCAEYRLLLGATNGCVYLMGKKYE